MRTLVTTAIQDTWKNDDPTYFLGDWCKIYSQKKIWSQMDSITQEYHWDDRSKLFSDYKYLVDFYEKALNDLTNKLNDKEKEVKKLTDDIKGLKVKMEDQEKSHEEAIDNLHRTLSTEINQKKDLQNKYNKMSEKLQSTEAKEQDLETKLTNQSEEFTKLKNEHEKLKSILSYVKDNCKF